MHIYPWQTYPIPDPSPPIGHRSLEHHYIESLGHDDIKSDVPRSGYSSTPTSWLSNLVVQSTITPGEFDMWKCSDVLRSDVHLPPLLLVLQSSITQGQFDMWQNADVPRSGAPPTPWLSNLLVQSTITPGDFDMWKNSVVLRSDVHPLTNPP